MSDSSDINLDEKKSILETQKRITEMISAKYPISFENPEIDIRHSSCRCSGHKRLQCN